MRFQQCTKQFGVIGDFHVEQFVIGQMRRDRTRLRTESKGISAPMELCARVGFDYFRQTDNLEIFILGVVLLRAEPTLGIHRCAVNVSSSMFRRQPTVLDTLRSLQ